jgi:glycosyltransferase involved in cell wall biosynthesis
MTSPRLTVLICTHNRAALLKRVLASLNAARRPERWDVDILVAANACSDTTPDFLAQYQEVREARGWLPLQWFAEPVPGKSQALNAAMPRIDVDLTAFVDDDHRVHVDYLVEICAAAEACPGADIFCGRILPDWDGSEPAWVHDQGTYRIYPLPVPRFDLGDAPKTVMPDIAVPGGGNLFLRTPWLHKTGPFATHMGPTGHDLGGAEDADWVLRALCLGARLRYIPAVVQYHYVDASRLTLSYLMRKAYKRTASTVGLHESVKGPAVPRYLYRKLAGYVLSALTSLNQARRRFYLVRTAAALGEVAGHRRIKARDSNTLTTDSQATDRNA